jgi:DNA-binding LytR/AlgR family response regulator
MNQHYLVLKKNFSLFISISLGIFMFILFFQPFPFETIDKNNQLIIIAGLGCIVFLLLSLIRIPYLIYFKVNQRNDNGLLPFLCGFGIMVLSSVSFAFYLRYVGKIHISFFLMVKVSLICITAPVIVSIYDLIDTLKHQYESVLKEKKNIQKQVEKYEEDMLNKAIEFVSDNGSEVLTLQIAEVVYIRSADNYVEVVYAEGESFRKKLIRNTMRNIEQQIRSYSNFIRCHRICIVNAHFIEKLNKNYNNYWIKLKGSDEKIPVSRQYLLKIKEIM